MAIRRGEIITRIIENGLTHNIDASNRVTYPRSGVKVYNTVDTDITGSFINDVAYNNESPDNFQFGLDGVDDIIKLNSRIAESNTQTDITISIWFKTTGDGTSGINGLINEIAVHTPGRSRILLNDAGTTIYYTIAGVQRVFTLSSTISDNVWTNLTLTKDNVVGSKLYINSNLEYNNSSDTGVVRGAYATGFSGTVLGIGAESVYYLNGKIGCIHVYNRALSTTELTHNYNAMVGRFS
jgi:hypothetical protein